MCPPFFFSPLKIDVSRNMSGKLMANPMAKNRQSFRFFNLDHKREDLEVQSQSQTEPHISSRGVFFFWRGGGVEPAWVHFRLNPFPQDKLLLDTPK